MRTARDLVLIPPPSHLMLKIFYIMGKITNERPKQRHNPLHKDISSISGDLKVPRTKDQNTNENEHHLDAKTSRKILQLAKDQQDEIRLEEEGSKKENPSFLQSFAEKESDESDEEIDIEEDEEDEEPFSDFDEEIEVNEQDAAMFNQYFLEQPVNLADKIMAKINEKEQAKQQPMVPEGVKLPPKVIAAYEKIGTILSNYTHGKLPKLFKVLPNLRNWEDVLYVTNPEGWTPHAVYEGTKLFVSNLQASEAQKFVEMVLLERFRSSIEDSEDHSVNYHVYRALKKSLYKPAAFFKGFLFPLVDSHCSVREATIAASVLAKVSVPVLHSSVALAQLVQREFKPSTTVFIRVLIEKKYALPYQTLDEIVFYFMRFRVSDGTTSSTSPEPLPVVWHKAFLAFAQRYKNDITDDQRDFLLETVRQHFHRGMGPEIRRELLAGRPRVTAQAQPAMMDAF